MRFYWSIVWLRGGKSLEFFMGWIINDYIPVGDSYGKFDYESGGKGNLWIKGEGLK